MPAVTLNLSDREFETVEQMCKELELSKTALFKTALRTYQLIQRRVAEGETMSFSGDKERIALFIGPGF